MFKVKAVLLVKENTHLVPFGDHSQVCAVSNKYTRPHSQVGEQGMHKKLDKTDTMANAKHECSYYISYTEIWNVPEHQASICDLL